jgi:hypothetical protein
MKIFSLTDILTKRLKQHKLHKQTFELAGELVPPGAAIEVKGTAADHPQLAHLLKVGAAAADSPPKEYLEAKALIVIIPPPPKVPTFAPVSKRKGG